MLIRLAAIIATTYAILTYVLHLNPVESMYVYAAMISIVFVAGEIVVATRS